MEKALLVKVIGAFFISGIWLTAVTRIVEKILSVLPFSNSLLLYRLVFVLENLDPMKRKIGVS